MPAKRTAAKKAGAKTSRTTRKKRGPAEPRGPEAAASALALDDAAIADLVKRIEGAKGAVLSAYRDPYGGTPLVLASLRFGAVPRTARDHGARDLRSRARVPHPRAQHREGAQPPRPQPRGHPDGAGAREGAAALEGDGSRDRVRNAGVPHARLRVREARPVLRKLVQLDAAARRHLPREGVAGGAPPARAVGRAPW